MGIFERYEAEGIITEGKYKGRYIYCLPGKPMLILDIPDWQKLEHVNPLFGAPGWSWSNPRTGDSKWLCRGEEEERVFFGKYPELSPKTLKKAEIVSSASIGPDAGQFVKGTLIGGAAMGAAAALASSKTFHTVTVTYKNGGESAIRFNSRGFQIFCEKLHSLLAKQSKDVASVSAADEILKFKQLLDQGIITEREFAAKKKELLGL